MTNFIEAQHPRGTSGLFTERTYTFPEVELQAAWPPERFDPSGGPEVIIDHGHRYRVFQSDGNTTRSPSPGTPGRFSNVAEAKRTFQSYARLGTVSLLTPVSHADAIEDLDHRDANGSLNVRLVTITQRALIVAPLVIAGPDPSWEKPLLVDIQSGDDEFFVTRGRAIVQIASGVNTQIHVEAGACLVLILANDARAMVAADADATAFVSAAAGSAGQLVLNGPLANGTVTGRSTDFRVVRRWPRV